MPQSTAYKNHVQ